MRGDRQEPFALAPPDWKESGVPYGAFCRCARCGLVARSTMMFDFYADGPGLPMRCESCKLGAPRGLARVADVAYEQVLKEEAEGREEP